MTFGYPETIKQHLSEILTKGMESFDIKIITAFTLGIIESLIGKENQEGMSALMVLIVFDFITAIMAKHKMGEVIESKKALKTVTKIVVYTLFVSASFISERAIPGTTFMDQIAISFLIITELISIMENIGRLGYAIPKKLLNTLSEMRDSK